MACQYCNLTSASTSLTSFVGRLRLCKCVVLLRKTLPHICKVTSAGYAGVMGNRNMPKILVLIVFFLILSSCASKEYNEKVRRIISYELDDSLNKLTKEHLICFKCEMGHHPNSVLELEMYKPQLCKALFTGKPFDFIDPAISSYKITTKKWNDRTTFVFSSQGVEYKDFDSIKDETTMTMNIWFNEYKCTHNKLLQPTANASAE